MKAEQLIPLTVTLWAEMNHVLNWLAADRISKFDSTLSKTAMQRNTRRASIDGFPFHNSSVLLIAAAIELISVASTTTRWKSTHKYQENDVRDWFAIYSGAVVRRLAV